MTRTNGRPRLPPGRARLPPSQAFGAGLPTPPLHRPQVSLPRLWTLDLGPWTLDSEKAESDAPAEPTQARSASDGHRREARAPSPSDGRAGCEHVSDLSTDSLRTEYSVLSTQHSPQPANDLDPKSVSVTSQREAPHSDPAIIGDDAATSCPAETFMPGAVPKTIPSTTPTSQENQKREAPPIALSPPPPLAPSPCPQPPAPAS
jgi:hypothetical protein